jgi:hypothetical protein
MAANVMGDIFARRTFACILELQDRYWSGIKISTILIPSPLNTDGN